MPVLAFNGSAPVKPSHPGVYQVPGLAMLASLVATTRILSANTVIPRVDAMKRSFLRRLWTGRRPDRWDPLDLVVDLTDVATTEQAFGRYTWGEEQIRASDPVVKDWETGVACKGTFGCRPCRDITGN